VRATPTSVSREAIALFGSSIVADLMVPASPESPFSSLSGEFATLTDRYIDAGITWASFTVATDSPASVEATILSIAAARAYFRRRDDRFLLIESIADIKRAKEEHKLAVSLNFQGTNPFVGRLDLIEVYKHLGVAHALLCYNEKNAVADGCYERTDAGLSRFGLRVVNEMNRVGMIVDVTHTGRRSSLEAIEASSKPVIMSHSNAHALVNHPRNITDTQIRAVAATDGVVGIAGINAITTGGEDLESISPESIFRHVDYVVQLVGPAHAGYGLDYITKTDLLLKMIKLRPDTFPADQNFTRMWSAGPDVIEPTVDLMLKAGYTDADVRGVLGGNWMRVLGTALAS
jgi:membrane dipeptidase